MLTARPYRKTRLTLKTGLRLVEREEGTGGESHAHGEEEEDPQAGIREAAPRHEGGREGSAGEGDARRDANPRAGSGESRGRRGSPPHGSSGIVVASVPFLWTVQLGRARSPVRPRGFGQVGRSRHYSAGGRGGVGRQRSGGLNPSPLLNGC